MSSPLRNTLPHPGRRFGRLLVLATLVGTLLTGVSRTADAAVAPAQSSHAAKPTIVLVHGAWADASGWSAELEDLRNAGYDTIAVANPLRGLTSDAAYLRSVLDTIPGPVVLVGHSYGGAVIGGAAAGAANVKALVYVAAFVPDRNEPVGQLARLNPGSLVTDDALLARPYPLPDHTTGVDLYLRCGIFHQAFAADLPKRTTATMCASQRPLAAAAFSEPAGPAAWRTIPSWYLLATQDQTIPPATQDFMAARAHATVVRVRASHVAMISHPGATTQLILTAARAAG